MSKLQSFVVVLVLTGMVVLLILLMMVLGFMVGVELFW